ncbi:amino acid transporter [Rhizobium sp. 18055]|uniref:amino acid transporter n=1 Tax=Rhizobium sp. 18055 TaxID=2681403 RepID=UPI00135CBB7D|nr:amino acid transporter [Rhizobium sp. 18055]
MSDLVRNERTKLTATYVNGLAIAVIAVGGIAPAFGAANGISALTPPLVLTVCVCLFLSAALHLLARRILKGLRP